MSRPAAFFDRDGVLNVDHNYVHRQEDWEWQPGAIEAIKKLNDRGYAVVVVTNQSGIGRGFYSEDDLATLNHFVAKHLASHGARIDGFYHCPHLPDEGCECRKPKPGMLLRAIEDLDLEAERSFLIGDRQSDLDAASAAGIKGYLYEGGDLRALLEKIL